MRTPSEDASTFTISPEANVEVPSPKLPCGACHISANLSFGVERLTIAIQILAPPRASTRAQPARGTLRSWSTLNG